MSYEKLRSITLGKNRKLRVCIADSSIRPLYYRTLDFWDDGKSLDENLKDIVVNILEGNLQPTGSCKFRKINVSEMGNALNWIMKKFAPETSFTKDLELKLSPSRTRLLEEMVAELYGVPYLKGDQNVIHDMSLHQRIKEFDKESKKIYDDEEKRLMDEDIEIIKCAWSSDIFEGKDVLINREDETILADQTDYTSGMLRNASKAIRLGKVKMPYLLAGSTGNSYLVGCGASLKKAYKDIRNAGISKMDKLPFSDFPYKEFGFDYAKETA